MATSESTEGIIYEGRRFISAQNVEILDLISEGEIEGLATGNYIVNGISGEIGWRDASFSGYQSLISGQQFLRSVYWNETPVIDDNGRFNFQQASLDFGNGTPDGNLNLRIGERDIINENFNPIVTVGSKSNFLKEPGVFDAGFSSLQSILERNGLLLGMTFATMVQRVTNLDLYTASFGNLLKNNLQTSQRIYRFKSNGVKFVAGKRYQFVIQLGLGQVGSTIFVATHYTIPRDGINEQEYSAYAKMTSTTSPETFTFNMTPSVDSSEMTIYVQGPCSSKTIQERSGIRTEYTCETSTPILLIADIAQVREVSGGSIPSTITVAKEDGENFLLKAYASPSFNPTLYQFLFLTSAEYWGAYGGASMSHIPLSSTTSNAVVITPSTTKHPDNSYGGISYNTSRAWDFEQEGCVALELSCSNFTNAKVRFSIRKDTTSHHEILGFELDITNKRTAYELLSIANYGTTSAVLFISCSEPEKIIHVGSININRAMLRIELDMPKRLELFKKYNFSLDAYGKYVGYNDVTSIPLCCAISNRKNGVEMISSLTNTSTVQI